MAVSELNGIFLSHSCTEGILFYSFIVVFLSGFGFRIMSEEWRVSRGEVYPIPFVLGGKGRQVASSAV